MILNPENHIITGFSANLEYPETHPKYDFSDFGTEFLIDDPREILKIHIQGLFRRKPRLNSEKFQYF